MPHVLVPRFAVLVNLVMDTRNEHNERSILDFKERENATKLEETINL